jgi:hypothetical protein
VVEHNLAKVGVASSSLVSRSSLSDMKASLFFWLGGRVVMQRPAKPCTPVRFRPQPSRPTFNAQVAKQVDARDLKSLGNKPPVPVRLRPWAPFIKIPYLFLFPQLIFLSDIDFSNLNFFSNHDIMLKWIMIV